MKNLPMTLWAAEELPSYKIERNGVESLTNAELLSLIIGFGRKECDAVTGPLSYKGKYTHHHERLLSLESEEEWTMACFSSCFSLNEKLFLLTDCKMWCKW